MSLCISSTNMTSKQGIKNIIFFIVDNILTTGEFSLVKGVFSVLVCLIENTFAIIAKITITISVPKNPCKTLKIFPEVWKECFMIGTVQQQQH